MREPSNCLPTAFQLPSNCLCVGPPITPRVLEHPTPGWNRAGVPTPRPRPEPEPAALRKSCAHSPTAGLRMPTPRGRPARADSVVIA